MFVALHGVEVGLLDEKEDKQEGCEGRDDDEFNDGETLLSFHTFIIA